MRAMQPAPPPPAIGAIERPSPRLLQYYTLACLLTGPAFPIAFIPHYFKYHTLRYQFDAEGISLRWGILFRREIVLNYSRIQDIHLSSNLVERWLGLAKVEIQTAAGSAKAEMIIEGIKEYEAVRDFLYSRMRGTQDSAKATSRPASSTPATEDSEELVTTLRAVAEELRAIRLALEKKRSGEN
jgi:putative membrane protein